MFVTLLFTTYSNPFKHFIALYLLLLLYCFLIFVCSLYVLYTHVQLQKRVWSNLSEVGFVIDHLMPDVVDRVDDILACCIVLRLKWHRTMSISYKQREGLRNMLEHVAINSTKNWNQYFITGQVFNIQNGGGKLEEHPLSCTWDFWLYVNFRCWLMTTGRNLYTVTVKLKYNNLFRNSTLPRGCETHPQQSFFLNSAQLISVYRGLKLFKCYSLHKGCWWMCYNNH